MGSILPVIDIVNERAKLEKLKETIENILRLVEDASRFVIEYKADGAAGKLSGSGILLIIGLTNWVDKFEPSRHSYLPLLKTKWTNFRNDSRT